jgi:hypothetical protein
MQGIAKPNTCNANEDSDNNGTGANVSFRVKSAEKKIERRDDDERSVSDARR